MKENNTIEEESLILAPVNRTQGKWIAENSAIIKMVNPAGSFDNGKLTIAQCYSTIEGNSFEYKHLHPEIEKAFEENPLLMEKVITDKMAKANATFICEAVNNYDKLKEDNSILMDALKEIIDLFPENPKLPISYQVLGIANEALSKTNNLFRKKDIEAIKKKQKANEILIYNNLKIKKHGKRKFRHRL